MNIKKLYILNNLYFIIINIINMSRITMGENKYENKWITHLVDKNGDEWIPWLYRWSSDVWDYIYIENDDNQDAFCANCKNQINDTKDKECKHCHFTIE